MTKSLIIIKSDGKPTHPAMAQAQAKNYLQKLIHNNRFASLSQALNDMYSTGGTPTGAYLFDGKPVKHASSGDGEQSVSLFYHLVGETITLFAMGEHIDLPKPKVRYKLSDYGQAAGAFAKNATITLV